ncbi:MAG: peptide chain release factor N(5)-glutamine methyltransferase [Eubacterium sp.]|nr:peptide chain release factor N(5)-glutamine methyltransferase [Eubacterium sp.]
MIQKPEVNSLRELRGYGEAYLKEAQIADAKTDAWLLLEYAAHITKSYYFMHMHEEISEEDAARYRKLVERRAARIPLQYLTGEAWCYGNRFLVNHHVLIPRQDTEILIEEAARRLHTGMSVLDLCTGSGCILISLLKQKMISGTGSDLSADALAVARKNAELHHVRAEWIRSDLFSEIEGRFDMIVSNPPYIPADIIPLLDPEVRDHEPHMALEGGTDGLDFYRRIIEASGRYLRENGWLCVEIGYDEGNAVKEMFVTNGYSEVSVIQDYAGLDRVVCGIKRGV